MSSLVRRRPHIMRPFARDEWITPFDRLFDDMLNNMFPTFSQDLGDDFFVKGSYPKVNVVSQEDSVMIEAAVPGLNKSDVNVEVRDGVLTIRGESNQHGDIQNDQYVKREIKRSAFQRSFRLGENLDESKIEGAYDNGILTLTIPKLTPTPSEQTVRTIEIS